ncbi:SPOSA6832_01285 [Sporobolomyces salmonicolor]|uniref:SPOSA6832_01285-mRNA-1:cds n=1 Tax=Sporidiobolus salmonicolor TaxID=5005 RepID=A0A0D6EIF1_SPOSA|nr:SPOSA6832_01285 [Sporobolomyces salmonicolor]
MASLASPTGSVKGGRLQKPRPVPAGSRPKKLPDQFPVAELIRVPLRVLSPPKATGMVGSVMSMKATPINDVRLADVIANKHLSPLSLKDFEGYLVFKEYSAENLYFILCAPVSSVILSRLNEYEKEYNAYLADPSIQKISAAYSENTDPSAPRTASHLPDYLADSLGRGLDVFFAPDGALELNLPRVTRDKTLVEAGNSGNPKDFAEARDIIEHSLNRSLVAHSRSVVANAGPRRLLLCFCLGLLIFLLGCVPALVAILTNHARGYRVIGLPFIAFGTTVMVMAMNRICGIIWFLGERRQLLPWELATPTVTSASIVPISCPSSPSSTYSWDDESSVGCPEDKSPDLSFCTQASATPYPWEKQDVALDSFPSAGEPIRVNFDPGSTQPPTYKSGGKTSKGVVPESARKLKLFPSQDCERVLTGMSRSAAVWGPVTSIFSPDVARAQWRIVVLALLFSVGAICTVGVVLMAVPNRSP